MPAMDSSTWGRLAFAGAWYLPALAAASVQWQCRLSDDLVRLHCEARAAVDAATAPAETPVQVRGVAYPLELQRRWTIDLWSVPTEPEFVRLLARSVLCHRRPACTAVVDGPAMQALGGRGGS